MIFLCFWWQQARAYGKAHQVRDIVQAELLHHIGAMSLHGLNANDQLVGNLLVGASLGNQFQHLHFTWGKHAQLRGAMHVP